MCVDERLALLLPVHDDAFITYLASLGASTANLLFRSAQLGLLAV